MADDNGTLIDNSGFAGGNFGAKAGALTAVFQAVIGGAPAPTVDFDPDDGITILPGQEIVMRVTGADLPHSVVTAEFPSGAWEVIYLQDRFATGYRKSSVQDIVGGVQFTIRRLGNWPATPTLHYDQGAPIA